MRLVQKLVPSIATVILGLVVYCDTTTTLQQQEWKRKYRHCEVLEVMIETVY